MRRSAKTISFESRKASKGKEFDRAFEAVITRTQQKNLGQTGPNGQTGQSESTRIKICRNVQTAPSLLSFQTENEPILSKNLLGKARGLFSRYLAAHGARFSFPQPMLPGPDGA